MTFTSCRLSEHRAHTFNFFALPNFLLFFLTFFLSWFSFTLFVQPFDGKINLSSSISSQFFVVVFHLVCVRCVCWNGWRLQTKSHLRIEFVRTSALALHSWIFFHVCLPFVFLNMSISMYFLLYVEYYIILKSIFDQIAMCADTQPRMLPHTLDLYFVYIQQCSSYFTWLEILEHLKIFHKICMFYIISLCPTYHLDGVHFVCLPSRADVAGYCSDRCLSLGVCALCAPADIVTPIYTNFKDFVHTLAWALDVWLHTAEWEWPKIEEWRGGVW